MITKFAGYDYKGPFFAALRGDNISDGLLVKEIPYYNSQLNSIGIKTESYSWSHVDELCGYIIKKIDSGLPVLVGSPNQEHTFVVTGHYPGGFVINDPSGKFLGAVFNIDNFQLNQIPGKLVSYDKFRSAMRTFSNFYRKPEMTLVINSKGNTKYNGPISIDYTQGHSYFTVMNSDNNPVGTLSFDGYIKPYGCKLINISNSDNSFSSSDYFWLTPPIMFNLFVNKDEIYKLHYIIDKYDITGSPSEVSFQNFSSLILHDKLKIELDDLSQGSHILKIELRSKDNLMLFDFWSCDFTIKKSVNHAPTEPSNPKPSEGAANQSTSQTLSWSCSDPEGDKLTYDVFFESANPPSVKIISDLSTESLSKSGLRSGTTYYWYVKAKDNVGNSTNGPVWRFTTITETGSKPVAHFTASKTTILARESISFTDQSTNNPTSWSWNFGDGSSISTQRNPSHTYTTAGTYTIKLTVSNSYGSDIETKTNYITVDEAQTTPTELNANLVSYWPIDETAGSTVFDSHTSNNCVVNAGVTINQVGLRGKAASFSGTSDGLTTGKKASALGIGGGHSKSVSIWIKPSSSMNVQSSCGIIDLGSHANQRQFGIKLYGYWMFDSWYGAVMIGSDNNKLADGEWHHIVVTYNSDGHKVRTYLDGSFVKEDASKILNTGDDYGFSIGIGSQGKYIGLIDEVGLWSRALLSTPSFRTTS